MIGHVDWSNYLAALPFLMFLLLFAWDTRRRERKYPTPTYYSGACLLHLRSPIHTLNRSNNQSVEHYVIEFEDVDTGRFYRREPCVGYVAPTGAEVQVIVEPANIAAIEVIVD